MTANLRLSPSGPQIGEMALMPFRVSEVSSAPELGVTLTGTAQEVNAALVASLAGPFNSSHYLSVEAQLDVSNSSTNTLATVTITVQARVDGGSWTDVYTEAHNIGANSSVGEIGDDERQIRSILIHTKPIALSSWGAPPASAALIEVRLLGTMTAGEADTVATELDEMWLRFTDHSTPTDTPLRQPPSGPVIGGIDKAPLRDAEDSATLNAPLVLTGSAQDVNSALRASLTGPFDPTHWFSAEAELDLSNASTDTLASVTLTMQVSFDGGSTWANEDSYQHFIGANGATVERQIRGASCHVLPKIYDEWGPPDDAPSMTVRVMATMEVGEAAKVQVEVSTQWLRLVEHSAAAP